MKNDRGIKLITDDLGLEPAHPLDAADQSIENDEIDRLIKLCADESTAEIDFEAIKQRAVASARIKEKVKRGKVRRAISYALFACASLVMGFTIFSVLKNSGGSRGTDITALNTPAKIEPKAPNPGKTPSGSRGSDGDQTPLWRMEAGAVSNDAYKDLTKKVSEFFPESLPSNMMKLVEDSDAHVSAYGTDRNGVEVSYDLVMSTEPPIPLEIGEACSVEDGDYLVYYWQVSEDNCVSVRFEGFEHKQADSMFDSLAKRIVQIVPDDGRR
ncbi:MAG: hypothetical protein IKZ82_09410 [Clostridia bacterium]|nr:hypothetical protein [Clostridia bacterium]